MKTPHLIYSWSYHFWFVYGSLSFHPIRFGSRECTQKIIRMTSNSNAIFDLDPKNSTVGSLTPKHGYYSKHVSLDK